MNIDDVLARIRKDTPDSDTTRAAADAVRARLGLDDAAPAAPGRIESCAGFQVHIPGLVAGRLSEAETLLVQDHTRECVPCRRVLIAARAGTPPTPSADRSRSTPAVRPWGRHAAAAAAIVVVALAGWGITHWTGAAPEDLTVVATDGGLWRLENGRSTLLAAGSVVNESDVLRTQRGGGAVLRMIDGSRVEMHESTQMRVERRRDGATIRLAQGGLIVEASEQGSGRLEVATGDALASVKGTIFSVNAGLGGSRVAVLEGAVQVNSSGRKELLEPGDQTSSRPGLEPAPLRQAFAWSRDAARYDELLAELRALRADLEAGVTAPAARHDTRLLDRAPEGTILYAAIPNLTESLDDASRIFRDHLNRSETLREWWEGRLGSAEAERELESGLAKLNAIGRELGSEVVVTIAPGTTGELSGPVFLAELRSPETFRAVAEREGLTSIPDLELRIVDGVLVFGPREALTKGIGGTSPFAATAFRNRLADAYRDGAGWIFGADLETMVARHGERSSGKNGLEALGADNVRHLVVERKERGATSRTSAGLTFGGPRRGIASWLAEPGPMGGLRFVSPDASLVASFLLTEPGIAVRELFMKLGDGDPEFERSLEKFRETSGVDPIADLADPLGGEFTLALDGPILPTPSWKIVAEVYDPARLQNALATVVERINGHLREQGRPQTLKFVTQTIDGRTWCTLRATSPTGRDVEVVYTVDGGYLVAAPSRALVERALQTKRTGVDLASTSRFRALLPAGNRADFSAIVFENVAPLLTPLANAARGTTDPDRKALEAIAGDGRGHLIYAFAGSDRIEIASDGSGGLGAEIGKIVALAGSRGPGGLFDPASREEAKPAP